MTTKLDKTLTRETKLVYEGRLVLVDLAPNSVTAGHVQFRLKGTQKKWRVSMEEVFLFVKQKGMASVGNC